MPSPPPVTPEFPLPTTIGRYAIVRFIGEGAMGRVLLAHDPVLDRDVAVKHLRTDLKIPRDARDGLFTRMRHEARAAARVAHPNLVVLHDMGEDPDIGLYLVFEYVEGPTLKARIAEGPVPPRDVARLARDLGDALTIAHEAGILHRDIKPENVILSRGGGKIADFGIARIPDSTLTHQGGLLGTPAYSAPETFRSGSFSPASDQFSLGAMLYEALAGRRAFPGDDAIAVASSIATHVPEPAAASLGLPPAVDDVLARALAKTPDDRFANCADFGAALARAIEPAATRAPVVRDRRDARSGGAGDVAPPSARDARPERKSGQVVLGAAVVVATAALLIRSAVQPTDTVPVDPPLPSASRTTAAPVSTLKARAASAPHSTTHSHVEPAVVPVVASVEPKADGRAGDSGAPPVTSAAPSVSGLAGAPSGPAAPSSDAGVKTDAAAP